MDGGFPGTFEVKQAGPSPHSGYSSRPPHGHCSNCYEAWAQAMEHMFLFMQHVDANTARGVSNRLFEVLGQQLTETRRFFTPSELSFHPLLPLYHVCDFTNKAAAEIMCCIPIIPLLVIFILFLPVLLQLYSRLLTMYQGSRRQ